MDKRNVHRRRPGERQDVGSAMGGFAEEAAIEGVLRGICYPDDIDALVCDLCDELDESEQPQHPDQDTLKAGCDGGEGRHAVGACEASGQVANSNSSESGHQQSAFDSNLQARNPLNGVKSSAPRQLNGSVLANLASMAREASFKSKQECGVKENRGKDSAVRKEQEICRGTESLEGQDGSAIHTSSVLSFEPPEERSVDATWGSVTMTIGVGTNDSHETIEHCASARVCAMGNLKQNLGVDCANSSTNGHTVDSIKTPGYDPATSQEWLNPKEKGKVHNFVAVTGAETVDAPEDIPNMEKPPDTVISELHKLSPVSLLDENGTLTSTSTQMCKVTKAPQKFNVNKNKSKVLNCTDVEHKDHPKNSSTLGACVNKHPTSSAIIASLSKPSLTARTECPEPSNDCSHMGNMIGIGSKYTGCKMQEVQPENSDNDDTSCAVSPRSSVSSSMCSDKKANSAPASVAGDAFVVRSERLPEQDGWQRLSNTQQDSQKSWKSEKMKQPTGTKVPQAVLNARDTDVQSFFITSIHSMAAQYSARDSKNTGMKIVKCGDSKIPKCMDTTAAGAVQSRQDQKHVKSERHQECAPAHSKKDYDRKGIDEIANEQRDRVHEMHKSAREKDGVFWKDAACEKRVPKTTVESQLPVASLDREYTQKIQTMSTKKVVSGLLQPPSYSSNGLLFGSLNQNAATSYQGVKPMKPLKVDSELGPKGAVTLKLDHAAQKSNPGLKDLDWGWEDDISEYDSVNQSLQLAPALPTLSMTSDLIGQLGTCMKNDKADIDISTKMSYSGGPRSNRSLSRISGLSEVSVLGQSDSTILTADSSGHLADRSERAKKKKKKTKPKQKYQEGLTGSMGLRDDERSPCSQGALDPSIPKHHLGRCSPCKLKDKEHRICGESAQRDSSHMNFQMSKPSFEHIDGGGIPSQLEGVKGNQSTQDMLPSAKTARKKKTKLSPYAAEYVKQGDPYISQPLAQHTTPMVAHMRPLNSLLAQLQRPQAAKQRIGSLPEQNILGGGNPVHTLESVEERIMPEENLTQHNGGPLHGGEPEKGKKCVRNDALDKLDNWSSTPGMSRQYCKNTHCAQKTTKAILSSCCVLSYCIRIFTYSVRFRTALIEQECD